MEHQTSWLWLTELHATVPQIGGMYAGDRLRKKTLIDFGFRLPSAIDNRPHDNLTSLKNELGRWYTHLQHHLATN